MNSTSGFKNEYQDGIELPEFSIHIGNVKETG